VEREEVYGRKQLIARFHECGIIKRQGPDYPEGFTLKSGLKSDIYINIRDLIKYPPVFNFTMHIFWQFINSRYNNQLKDPCIIGIPTMGAAIAPIVAYKRLNKLVVIRQSKKDHGIGKALEGDLTHNIILIDDVITSGSSIKETISNHIVPVFGDNYNLDVFVIVDRRENQESDFKLHSLATLDEIKKFDPRLCGGNRPRGYKLNDGTKSGYSACRIKKS
jgi:orotate phosphoribosyltransferase